LYSNCKVGIANANVFQLQVLAHHKISLFSRAKGITFSCISVGVLNHSFSRAFSIG